MHNNLQDQMPNRSGEFSGKPTVSIPEVLPLHGILVVEPDPDLQWRLARILTVEGNRVVGTSSGDGALALISEWPVELVLVDENLPGMDSLEVVRRLSDVQPGVQVVLLTNEDNPDLHVAARLAGAVACLPKPFHLDALRTVMRELCAESVSLSAD